jgi:hypothetical protein
MKLLHGTIVLAFALTLSVSGFARGVGEYTELARKIWKFRYEGVIPDSAKSFTIARLKAALYYAGASPSGGRFEREATFDFDNNMGFTLMMGLIDHNRTFAVQAWVAPWLDVQIYVGQSDPGYLVETPPAQGIDGPRLANDLTIQLSERGLSMGPVNPQSVGWTFAQQMYVLGVPMSAYNLQFSVSPQIGNGGNSLALSGDIATDFFWGTVVWYSAMLNSNGTFDVDVSREPLAMPFVAPYSGYSPF